MLDAIKSLLTVAQSLLLIDATVAILILFFTVMSKPRAAATKRKKSGNAKEYDEGINQLLANLDLDDKSTTPKIVATALLSLLTKDATKQHTSAKKLVSAYTIHPSGAIFW
jgi:hypothetical protein